MPQNSETLTDLDKRIEEVDEAIITHNKIISKLTIQRYDLVSRKLDLEMDEALECAIESDISPRRVMDLIISEIAGRSQRLGA